MAQSRKYTTNADRQKAYRLRNRGNRLNIDLANKLAERIIDQLRINTKLGSLELNYDLEKNMNCVGIIDEDSKYLDVLACLLATLRREEKKMRKEIEDFVNRD